MIEKIVTSKTRVKILNLFLTHIDDRYYLRELERMLNESLSPLRRQLLKLEKMGILTVEYEANLKYYRLNRNFAGIEELRRLVLGVKDLETAEAKPRQVPASEAGRGFASAGVLGPRVRYDIMVLTAVSFFVLLTAAFIVYINSKYISQVAGLVSEKARVVTSKAKAAMPDEMVSSQWKIRAGNFPVLSSGETGGDKDKTSKEL